MQRHVVAAGLGVTLAVGLGIGVAAAIQSPSGVPITPEMLTPTEVPVDDDGLGDLAQVSVLSCATKITQEANIDFDAATVTATDPDAAVAASSEVATMAEGATIVPGGRSDHVAEFGVRDGTKMVAVAYAHRFEDTGGWAVDRIVRCIGPEEIEP